MRNWHRRLAVGLGLFIALHLVHHLAGAALGPAVHEEARLWLRRLYAHALVEPILLTAFVAQIATGLVLIRRFRPLRAGGLRAAQAISGLWVGAFVLVHLPAVLLTRLGGGTTDLGFAAAGVQDPLWRWVFVPYYGTAIIALCLHLSIGLPRLFRAAPRPGLGLALGGGVAFAVLGVMAGFWHGFDAPAFALPGLAH